MLSSQRHGEDYVFRALEGLQPRGSGEAGMSPGSEHIPRAAL